MERKEVNITSFYKFKVNAETLVVCKCVPFETEIGGEKIETFKVLDSMGDEYILPTNAVLKRKINILVQGNHNFEEENVEIVFNGIIKHPTDKSKQISDFSVFILVKK
jgi:hypothetical protein